MAVPIPVEFYVETPPADNPESVQELLNDIGSALGTSFVPGTDYILGQMGGVLPQSNVGPWFNNGEWWFWNASTGSYMRSADGVPIGMMTFYGGQGAPDNWLICDGSEVSRNDYNGLFQAIGPYWGGGDGSTTFNLPPGGMFYMNDGNTLTIDPLVPLLSVASTNWKATTRKGWGVQGGAQIAALLTAANMPALTVKVNFVWQGISAPGKAAASNLYGADQTQIQALGFQVLDANGTPLNVQAQQQFAIMPPFAAANVIIKYQ